MFEQQRKVLLFSRYNIQLSSSDYDHQLSVSVSVVKKMDNYNVNEAFLENLSLGLSSSLGKEREKKCWHLTYLFSSFSREVTWSTGCEVRWSHSKEVSQGPTLHCRVTKMPPCDLLAITAWEQRYSTQLPEVRTRPSGLSIFPWKLDNDIH